MQSGLREISPDFSYVHQEVEVLDCNMADVNTREVSNEIAVTRPRHTSGATDSPITRDTLAHFLTRSYLITISCSFYVTGAQLLAAIGPGGIKIVVQESY